MIQITSGSGKQRGEIGIAPIRRLDRRHPDQYLRLAVTLEIFQDHAFGIGFDQRVCLGKFIVYDPGDPHFSGHGSLHGKDRVVQTAEPAGSHENQRPVLTGGEIGRQQKAAIDASMNQKVATIRNVGPKIGPNDPCPCGSGKKYKKCCGKKR